MGPLVNPFLLTNLDNISRVRVSLRYPEYSITSRHTGACSTEAWGVRSRGEEWGNPPTSHDNDR